MTALWISCSQMTVRVAIDDQTIIREAAPVVQRFLGQPVENLLRWMKAKFGEIQVERL